MITWRLERLPIHGSRIVDVDGNEIVRDVYEKEHAEQIIKEHNAIVFAIQSGGGWNLTDWRNWRQFHALEAQPVTPEQETEVK